MKRIDPSDLVDMAAQARMIGIDMRCDLIYADAAHPLNNTFREAIYRKDARLWLHRTLARIVFEAARRSIERHGLRFVLTDGLRTIEGQQRMADTAIVRAHPEWTEEGPNILISKPGTGGHPRGMAIDIYLETPDGRTIDMGTQLDHFSTDPHNDPAARHYAGISAQAQENRALLENLMTKAAHDLGMPLWPLPSEWWDFRFPAEMYNAFAPISDADLPAGMRMCDA